MEINNTFAVLKKRPPPAHVIKKGKWRAAGRVIVGVFLFFFFIHDNKERDDGRKMYVVWISVDDN